MGTSSFPSSFLTSLFLLPFPFPLVLLFAFAFPLALALGLTVSAVSSPFADLGPATSELSSSLFSVGSAFPLVPRVLLTVLVFFASAFLFAGAFCRAYASAFAQAFIPLELEASTAAAGRRKRGLPLVEGSEAAGVVDFDGECLGVVSFFTSFAFPLGSCQKPLD